MRLGIEREHQRKDERDCGEKDGQNPPERMVGGNDCRADLDNKPCNYCVAPRHTINLPLSQLTEERVHFSPWRLRSIGYFNYYVEPATRSALLCAGVKSGFA